MILLSTLSPFSRTQWHYLDFRTGRGLWFARIVSEGPLSSTCI
ncbi:hypothetical protein SLEP1_g17254 [Rubroshorea leprosula]|uniref:Uncharacterized protein n=1 Tax=Rubroshorea leprosula TaxID=152421 RepID=A0AAV5J2I5_9ROSI|nr:hypothetical protein SLEP1_g17254 [Rubroshorea leprosula]